jgi:hypothetical protein
MSETKTDAEQAAWLADKIVALGDYAKEAAEMLRRWPVHQPQPVATEDEPVAWRFKLHEDGPWHLDEERPYHPERVFCIEPLYAHHPHREGEREATDAGVQPSADAARIAELEEEVTHVRRWYGDRLEILSAWARESLKGEQLHTFFNIVANARPHVSDEPEWFRAVIAKLAAKARTAGVQLSEGGQTQ